MRCSRTHPLWMTLALVLGMLPAAAAPAFAQTAAPAASPSPQSPAELAPITLEHAYQLYDDARYRDVVGLLDAYLVDHPRDARAYILRGDAKASLDHNDDALRDYNTGIKIAPDYAYGYVTRCQTRLDRGDSSGAMEDCNAAIRLDDSAFQAYENRGDVYFDRDNYAAAIADFDLAIGHGDNTSYVYAARCDAERFVGKHALASADCERALTINPKNRRGLWARGRLELSENDAVAAIADFNSYIAQRPNDSAAGYFYRGAAYNRVGKWALAIEDLNVYVNGAKTDGDGYAERGIAHAGLHETAAAESDFALAQKYYRHDADDAAVARIKAAVDAMHASTPLPLRPL